MSKFKVGETVKIVKGTGRDAKYIGRVGTILSAEHTIIELDIPDPGYSGGHHLAWHWEVEPYDGTMPEINEPDTREHTLLEWDSEDLIQELQRRGYVVS